MENISVKALVLITMLIGLLVFLIWQNNAIGISNYKIHSTKVPHGFHGFKIAQISDLHNKDFKGQVYKKIKDSNPDIIVITGDLIDRRNTNLGVALKTARQLSDIAPTYFVSGNHEQWSGEYQKLSKGLEKYNIQILDNSSKTLEKQGEKLTLIGIADPAIVQEEGTYLNENKYFEEGLTTLLGSGEEEFRILLSHRPEAFGVYRDKKIALIFSGHAHGGQIRLPFIGGLIAPNQGWFPKYTSGVYKENDTSMVVSRGLGNSLFPFRIFNSPEIIVVTLLN